MCYCMLCFLEMGSVFSYWGTSGWRPHQQRFRKAPWGTKECVLEEEHKEDNNCHGDNSDPQILSR